MSLPWVRLDANWYQNAKFLQLIAAKKWRAVTVWAAGLGWVGGHGYDGFVPAHVLPVLNGTPKDAADLVAVGLWESVDGGWQINDWAEYQLTTIESQARSERARTKAQRAANIRWHGTPEGAVSDG